MHAKRTDTRPRSSQSPVAYDASHYRFSPARGRRLPLAFILGAVLSANALAQVSGGADDEQALLEEVVVTGTRLRVDLPDGAYPLTVIDRAQLELSGQTFVGEYLQQLPFVTGSPVNSSTGARGEGGAFSRGIATLELRGLGPERTLVLLNGRRFVPGGNGASGVVDLNMIPMALIERVEIFKAGASVEYGADAVAGVVNLITYRETDGLQVDVRGSITGEGDGETVTTSVVWGRRGRQGEFMIGGEYVDQSAVSKDDRAFSRVRRTFSGPDNDISFDGSSAPPQGNFRTSLGRLTLSDGADGTEPGDFRPWIGDNSAPDTDRYNFNPFEDLRQPAERLSLFAQGRRTLNPNVSVFGEAFWHQRDSSTQLAPLPFFTTRETDVSVSEDNLYNPFGETLTDVRRRLVEAGPREFIQDNEAWRFVLGADGTLAGWFWDASAVHGRNETDQRQTGDLLDSRLRSALGPSFIDSAGNPRCGTSAAPIEGCVPLNLFGGAGSITPEMLAWAGTTLEDSGFNEQTVFSANITGSPISVPAGDLALATGIEVREERAADNPDPQTVLGNTSGSARSRTAGSFDSREVYLEMGLPLLRDAPGAELLEVDMGVRLVDFSNFGRQTVSEFGFFWQPMATLQFRGAWSEAFRAPNVRELFGGFSQSNPIVEDPCADFSALSPVAIERCVAQGVPADGSFTQSGEETPQLSGGNRDLDPEEAEILTAGVTWTSAAVPELVVNLDFYDIAVDSGIAGLGANTILEQCLATGAEAFCGRIERGPNGDIEQVSARLQNLATESARGVDADVRFAHDLAGGRIQHRALVSYLDERDIVAFPGAEPLAGAGGYDQDNFGAIPRWRGSYNLNWRSDRWGAGYALQWIGSLEESGGVVAPGTVNAIDDMLYHDVWASYRVGERLLVSAGIDNLTDEQPPFFGNADEANTDVSTYRLLGRGAWLRVSFGS
ncbi:MAG: TonB-dependent receptor [Halieaceae bacterium]|jgi:outer membrane receptor protein involved in Fe transport|nr:TonB-dependent receptor [Halieaceae bacterium]